MNKLCIDACPLSGVESLKAVLYQAFLERLDSLDRTKCVFLRRIEGQIMNLTRPLLTWSILLIIVRALVAQLVHGREFKTPGLSILPSQSSSFDGLNWTSDISTNRPAVFCDGDEYGRNLIVADCRDAITGIKRSTQRLRFAERSADPHTWDIGLPSRQIGGKNAAS